MQVRYIVHHNGAQLGPLTFAEIEGQLKSNRLFPTDYVYVGERGDWLPMLEFILVHGPKEKVLQPTLKTQGAGSPLDDRLDWERFTSGIPAALGTTRTPTEPVLAYPTMPPAAASIPPTEMAPPPPPAKSAKSSKPARPPKTPQVPRRPAPTARPKALQRIDASAVARVDVMPAQATRLTIQITGTARVGEELEILVVAQTESGELDRTFNDVVQIACDRPLAGLGPLQFVSGTARLRVQCLTQGTHEFSLILGQSGPREFTSRPETASMENHGGVIH